MKTSPAPYTVQHLEDDHDGFKGWRTFAIRDKRNVCLAIVGDVDHLTAGENEGNAALFHAAPDLVAALELCYTRIFNSAIGMDLNRDPEATERLNQEAMDAASAALAKAKG